MTVEVLAGLLRANVAAGLAIVLILALRRPALRLFGPEAAYLFWIVPPLAAIAGLAPTRSAAMFGVSGLQAPMALEAAGVALRAATGPAPAVMAFWLAGAAARLALLIAAQRRFLKRVRDGKAGPAVVGFAWPRMVTPSDYEARFSEAERQVVRAHERAHIERNDPRANAFVALMQAVNWFNPLVHVAAHYVRLDQELACDAVVMRRYPQARRRYAETLLKTQLAPRALPLGCHWGAPSVHPLEERIGMLGQAPAGVGRRAMGGAAVVALAVAASYGAWATKPARAAQASFYQFEAPQLWSVEVLGGGGPVKICTDATLRAGFTRPTPVFGDQPCAPDAIPTGAGGAYAFRCKANGRAFGVSSVAEGDLTRDFTTRLVVEHLDSREPGYRQTRRHRRLGPCPSDWIIGDQAGRSGAMVVNSVSAQRMLIAS